MSDLAGALRLERLRDLPALPAVVGELIAALARDDIALDEIAAAVSRDPGLAAKVLRLANSSFYGVQSRVTSIRQAISVLGLRSVSTLVSAAAVSECFRGPCGQGFDPRRHWRHGVGVAICAGEIARRRHLEADVAFTAGLLHDLGQLVLAHQLPDAYEATVRWRREHDGPRTDAEVAVLGLTHADLGGQVAARWHFGALVADAIALHHAPPAAALAGVVDAVHVADAIAHALDLARDPDELVPAIDPGAWNRLGLSQGELFMLFEATEREVAGLGEALAT